MNDSERCSVHRAWGYSRDNRLRLVWLLALAGIMFASLLVWGSAQASPLAQTGDTPTNQKANLDQCRNGALASPARCTDQPAQQPGQGWVNGNANGTQAHWAEGQSIAYRIRFEGLTAGTHTVEIQYDFTAPSGKHAIDYLTSYNRTETDADACAGVLSSAQCASLSKLPIPVDPVLATCSTPQHDPAVDGGVPQVPGEFYLYNGTMVSATYVGTHACQGDAIQVKMQITFSVAANGTDAVLAWGGHIAAQFDWGRGMSAHSIPGSPYHMALLKLDGSPTGQQDRALQNSAVYSTDLVTHIQTGNPPHVNQPITDAATINGYQGKDIATSPVIAGTLKFYICADTTAPFEPPSILGCGSTSGTLVGSVTVNGNGTYISPQYIPTANGYYCFRSEFIPASGSIFPFARESNTLLNGENAECVLITGPTALSLTQLQAYPASRGGLLAAVILVLGLLGVVSVLFLRNQRES